MMLILLNFLCFFYLYLFKGAGLFTGGLQGGGVTGLGGGAGGSGLFNQTPHSQSQLFSGGTGLGGLGTGLGGGGATGLGMGGVGNNLFQSPISSAGNVISILSYTNSYTELY